jgi:hypothetical protein
MRDYQRDGLQPETVSEALRESYRNDDLAKLVSGLVGTKPPPTRKEDMLAALGRLLEGAQLHLAWDRLTSKEQAMAAQTAWSETGYFNRQKFDATWHTLGSGQLGEATESDQERDPNVVFGWAQRDKGRKASLLELLMPRGIMSREIRRRLREFVPEPRPPAVVGVEALPEFVEMPTYIWNTEARSNDRGIEQVPVVCREMELAALRDVLTVLRLVDAGKVAVTEKNRWPTPAAMRQVAGVLDGGDYYPDEPSARTKPSEEDEDQPGPIRAFAWPMLLQAGKLAQVRGSRLELSKAGRAALMAPPHEILRGLWERWTGSDLLDELRRINVVRGQTGNGRRHLTNPAERRVAIAAALSDCAVGRWVALDEFSRHMLATGNEFHVTSDPWTLYVGEQQYGSLGDEDWNILQLRYLLGLLMEYAATLGMVDVAFIPPDGARPDYGDLWGTDDLAFFSRYDGLMFLRLTSLGAYALGLNDSYAPAPPQLRKVITVDSNLEIAATGPLSPADILLLDTFASKSGEKVWRLDPERILDAEASGRSTAELVAFLEAASDVEVPEAVDQFVGELVIRAGALHDLGPARLIGCADPELAAFIAGHPAARKLCSLAGKDKLVVTAADQASFHRALRKLGFVLRQSPSATAIK